MTCDTSYLLGPPLPGAPSAGYGASTAGGGGAPPSLTIAAIPDQEGLAAITVSGTIANSAGANWTLNLTGPDGTDASAMLSATTGAITGGAASPSATLTPTFEAGAGNYIVWLTSDAGEIGVSEVFTVGDPDRGVVLIDMTGATETNTGQRAAGTTLGPTSTINLAAVHGGMDVGLDGYSAFQSVGSKPAWASRLFVILEVPSPDGTNSSGGSAFIGGAVSDSAGLSNQRGYDSTVLTNTAGAHRGGFVHRTGGSFPGSDTVLTGTLSANLDAGFNSDGRGFTAAGYTLGSASGERHSVTADTWNLGAADPIYVGIVNGMQAAAPLAGYSWGSGIKLWAGWK